MATITDASSATSGMSRLRIWMKPVHMKGKLDEKYNQRSNQMRQGDTEMFSFEEWKDDSVPEDPSILVPLMSSNDSGKNTFYRSFDAQKQTKKKRLMVPPPTSGGINFTSPLYVLPEKRAFCCRIGLGECIRCNRKRLQLEAKAHNQTATWSSSSSESIYSNNSMNFSSSLESNTSEDSLNNGTGTSNSKMKIGKWKKMGACSFCYIQYKRHRQKLGLSFPRPEDTGFWVGHSTKDENGDVTCPELLKLVCPLCFASGKDAHTIKFCPFLASNIY